MDEYPTHLCFTDLNLDVNEIRIDATGISRIVSVNPDDTTRPFTPSYIGMRPSIFDKSLISEVEKRPCLYKPILLIAERSVSKREEIWRQITESSPGSFSVDEVHARWIYLRTIYLRNRGHMNTPIGTGSGVEAKSSQFCYYDSMKFLDDFEEKAVTVEAEREFPSTAGQKRKICFGDSRKIKRAKWEVCPAGASSPKPTGSSVKTDNVDAFLAHLRDEMLKVSPADRAEAQFAIISLINSTNSGQH
ncbi:uncharacterized protein LOC107046342 [Diachasma alloeum]|uniref:uncharacterized protein LOC107046342 n=1 Tax=Diachasma alloeum TaxID=454923 RepID=UPI0007385180|nr:uncharacterized protein LOC107046342 [Diachasma alloeum]